jgi:hypothetical protein
VSFNFRHKTIYALAFAFSIFSFENFLCTNYVEAATTVASVLKINDPVQGSGMVTTTSYDSGSKKFLNVCQNGASFNSNVPNGFVTDSSVTIEIPGPTAAVPKFNATYTVDKDGSKGDFSNGTFTDAGYYTVTFANSDASNSQLNMAGDRFTFQILGNKNWIGIYDAPLGFKISSVTQIEVPDKNATNLDATNAGAANSEIDLPMSVDFLNFYNTNLDTTYDVTVQSVSSPSVTIESKFVRSRSLPTLSFGGLKNGHADSSSGVSYASDGTVVVTKKNDENFKQVNPLTESGDYTFTATDTAGNESVYELKFKIKLNASSYILVAVSVILLIALLVFIRTMRKKVRVR